LTKHERQLNKLASSSDSSYEGGDGLAEDKGFGNLAYHVDKHNRPGILQQTSNDEFYLAYQQIDKIQ